VAKILAKLFEILNRAETLCILRDVLVNSFKELLLSYWKVSPRYQKGWTRPVLRTGDRALRTKALICLNAERFREECMTGTYVFFECRGPCFLLLLLRASSLLFSPLLPLKAAAQGARNLIPALRTLCRYGFVVRTDNVKKRLFWAIVVNRRNRLELPRQRAHARRSHAPSSRPPQCTKGSALGSGTYPCMRR